MPIDTTEAMKDLDRIIEKRDGLKRKKLRDKFAHWDISYASESIPGESTIVKVDDIGLMPNGDFILDGYPYIAVFEELLTQPSVPKKRFTMKKYIRSIVYAVLFIESILTLILHIYS